MSESQQEQLTPEEIEQKTKEWNQQEVVKVQKHCASQGIQFKSFNLPKSRTLPPLVGFWYITTQEKGKDYWVISGDVPTDIVSSNVAKNAREVARHFSLAWQLKAANLEAELTQGNISPDDKHVKEGVINNLINKAEALSHFASDDKRWEE